MKLFALCLLVGFAAANSSTKLQWQPQKEYRFQYSGRMLSGIPELSTQNSGLGINCTVVLKTKTQSEIYLTIENPEYVTINGELQPVDASATSDWRMLRLPEARPVPAEHSRIMGQPISFSIAENGDLKGIRVSKEEPSWSVNFKKAMVSLFRVKFDSGSTQVEANTVGDEQRDYWTVEEETLFGRCEASYQVNELPEWIVSERPELIPHPESCQNGKYFEITRTFDMDKCGKLSSFQNVKIASPSCNAGVLSNCGDSSTRSSSTRFIACGTGNGPLSLQSVVNDGSFSSQMTGHKTAEYVVSGTFQTLLLKEVRSLGSSTSMPEVPRPAVEIDNMMYEYGKEWYGDDKKDGLIPASLLSSGRSLAGLMGGGRVSGGEIKALLSEVAADVHSSSGKGLSKVNRKLVSVARAMTAIAGKEGFHELYNAFSSSQGEESETARQLLVDAAIMCGTPQAVSFLATLVEQRKVSDVEAVHFFAWLPKTVVAPTTDLLEELFHLVTSGRMSPTVYSAAITGYARLVQTACVSTQRKETFPAAVLGDFCHPDSEIVRDKLIPHLAREIASSNGDEEIRTVNIFALGLIGHKNVITELTPVLERKATSSVDRIVAAGAIAFGPGSAHPSLVHPIILSVFANPAEATDVRIVAFNALLKMNPPMHVFQAIAAATRQETTMDSELLKVVNLGLYTLGHDCNECNLDSLASKARAAYAICRKTPGFLVPSSGAWYKTEMLKEMGMGYKSVVAWLAGQRTVLPKATFLHLEQFFGAFNLDTLNAGFWTNAAEYSSFLGNSELQSQIGQGLGSQWAEIVEKLQLGRRGSDNDDESSSRKPLRNLFFLNVLDSGYVVRSFGERALRAIKDKASEIILKGGKGNAINVQKTIEMSMAEGLFATDMGFPLWVEFRAPVTASIVGKITYGSDSNVSQQRSVSVSGKTAIASHFGCVIGTGLPFTREWLVTGIDQDSVINVPGTINAKLNLAEKKVSLSVVPGKVPIDVLHYEVQPYTSMGNGNRPFSLNNNAKTIGSKRTPVKSGSYRFGDVLGLELVAETETESCVSTGFSSFLDVLSLYNGNPVNMLMFGTTSPALSESGRPSLRRHRYVVRFNPSGSSTKEIVAEVKLGYATKVEGEETVYDEADSKPMLSASMDRLQASTGHGIALVWNLILKGGNRPRTFAYSVKASVGSESKSGSVIAQKWNVEIEGNDRKICVNGNLDLPVLPAWNIDELRTSLVHFRFLNEIGFGRGSCDESKIVVSGSAKAGERQRSHSRKSVESKACEETVRAGVKGSKLSDACEAVRGQAATLDEVDFKTELVNVNSAYEAAAVLALRGYLWPYYSFGRSSLSPGGRGGEGSRHQTLTRIAFKQMKPTFDLTVDGPFGHVVFSDVRVPSALKTFIPIRAGSNPASVVFGSQAVAPRCVADAKTVTSFAKRTVAFVPGKCFHLLAADCSERSSFGVTVRNVEGSKKEVRVMFGRTIVEMKPSRKGAEVFVDGKLIELPANGKAVSIDSKATVSRSTDRVIVIEAPGHMLNSLKTDCEEVLVIPSPELKGRVCGVCGSLDGSSSSSSSMSSGPKKCVYSSPDLTIASYRIQSDSCPAAHEGVKMQLMKENEKCSRSRFLPTMIASSYKASTGKCTVLRHVINQNGGKVCISKIPITQCGPSCMSRPGDKVEKTVPFTCLPEGRLADHYVRKAHRGETLGELRSMETSFSASIRQPRHCVHALVG